MGAELRDFQLSSAERTLDELLRLLIFKAGLSTAELVCLAKRAPYGWQAAPHFLAFVQRSLQSRFFAIDGLNFCHQCLGCLRVKLSLQFVEKRGQLPLPVVRGRTRHAEHPFEGISMPRYPFVD